MASKYTNVETAREVNIEYPLAAAAAIIVRLRTQKREGRRFRFLSVSGMSAVRDMNIKLCMFKDSRQIKVCLPPHPPQLTQQCFRTGTETKIRASSRTV